MKGSIVVIDRTYADFDLLYHWNLKDAYFVSRQKTNAAFKIIEEKETPQNSNILNDQIIINYEKGIDYTLVWNIVS